MAQAGTATLSLVLGDADGCCAASPVNGLRSTLQIHWHRPPRGASCAPPITLWPCDCQSASRVQSCSQSRISAGPGARACAYGITMADAELEALYGAVKDEPTSVQQSTPQQPAKVEVATVGDGDDLFAQLYGEAAPDIADDDQQPGDGRDRRQLGVQFGSSCTVFTHRAPYTMQVSRRWTLSSPRNPRARCRAWGVQRRRLQRWQRRQRRRPLPQRRQRTMMTTIS